MSTLLAMRAAYTPRNTTSNFIARDPDATMYYVDHFLAARDAHRDIVKNHDNYTFNEKHELRELISVAERKRDYWSRHANFDLERAMTIIRAVP